jgi:hypothetical protein
VHQVVVHHAPAAAPRRAGEHRHHHLHPPCGLRTAAPCCRRRTLFLPRPKPASRTSGARRLLPRHPGRSSARAVMPWWVLALSTTAASWILALS